MCHDLQVTPSPALHGEGTVTISHIRTQEIGLTCAAQGLSLCVHTCAQMCLLGDRKAGCTRERAARTLVGTSRTQGRAWDKTAAQEPLRIGSRSSASIGGPQPSPAIPSLSYSMAKDLERRDFLAAGGWLPGPH